MASRPVFKAVAEFPYVKAIPTEFKFYSGFALEQAQKSVDSLHQAYIETHLEDMGKILEVSTRSKSKLGYALSAFNLHYRMSNGLEYPLECVFQSSKCFEENKQYKDLLYVSAREAKKDSRLMESGKLIGFKLEGRNFPLVPRTLFYDFIYITALMQHEYLADEVKAYSAFTDIAFNPGKSINCQARAVALFVALSKTELLNKVMEDVDSFADIVYSKEHSVKTAEKFTQLTLFDLGLC